MASKGKQYFEVQVVNTNSEFADVRFGPFKSKKAVTTALRKKGWVENFNGEEGLWYCATSHCDGIRAKIVPVVLRHPSKIPRWSV
jgi:hypothetical protein